MSAKEPTRDRPDAAELIAVARATFTAEILPLLTGDKRVSGLMVANALATAAREIGARTLQLPEIGIEALRRGAHDDDAALYQALLADAQARVAITNPRYLAADDPGTLFTSR